MNWKGNSASQIERRITDFPWMLELSFLFWCCQSGLWLVFYLKSLFGLATSYDFTLCNTAKRGKPSVWFWSFSYAISGRQKVYMAFWHWAAWRSSVEVQMNIGADAKENRSSVAESQGAERDLPLLVLVDH